MASGQDSRCAPATSRPLATRLDGIASRSTWMVLAFLLLLPLVHLVVLPARVGFDDLVWLGDARAHPGIDGAWRALRWTPFGWRPAVAWHMALLDRLTHGSLLGLRISAGLLAGVAAGLLFLLFRRIVDPRAALVAAALWAVHPATRSALVMICDAGTLLFIAFTSAALLAHHRASELGARPLWAPGLLLFVLALLAKEWAVLSLPLFVLPLDRSLARPLRVRLLGAAPHAAAAVLAAGVHAATAFERAVDTPAFYSYGWALLRRTGAIATFVLAPSGRLQWWSSGIAVVVGAAGVLLVAAALFHAPASTRFGFAWLVCWTLPIVPVALLALPPHARYLAPAAAPALLLLARSLFSSRRGARRLAGLCTVAVLLALAKSVVLRPSAGEPFDPVRTPHAALAFKVWSEWFGVPEQTEGLDPDRAWLGTFIDGVPPEDEGIAAVFDGVLRGRAAEMLEQDARAERFYARACAVSRTAGTQRIPAFWMSDLRMRPEDVESFVRSRPLRPAASLAPPALPAVDPRLRDRREEPGAVARDRRSRWKPE